MLVGDTYGLVLHKYSTLMQRALNLVRFFLIDFSILFHILSVPLQPVKDILGQFIRTTKGFA